MAFGIDDAVAAGLKVLDKFVPDPNAKAQFEADLRNDLKDWDKQQSDTNTVEAANPNLFVSGWRPAIGWIGAAGLAYQYIVRPLAIGAGAHDLPHLDDSINQLVYAMLGLGGLRTFEKLKGVASK